MEIIKYDGSEKNWTLFKRKCGQHDWEWQDIGLKLLNVNGLINMEEFYGSSGYTIFFDIDSFIEFETGDNFFTDLLKNGDYDKAEKQLNFVIEACEYINKYMNDDSLILLHDASGSIDIVPKFASSFVDDATEYQVGIAR
jgi:hypothetical protein